MTTLILQELGEFLERTDGDTAAHLPATTEDDEEMYVFSLHTDDGRYGFFFSVHTRDDEVVAIQARTTEWIVRRLGFDTYVAPPGVVRDAVAERIELVEDPTALAILEDRCIRCQEDYLVDVTPKIDLLIDGYYAQRLIEEYCPECGQPLTQRQTFHPPQQYEAEFHNETAPPEHQFDPEDVDISKYTWEHARR